MTYLREIEQGLTPRITSPFDILVRNFFDTEAPFNPIKTIKLKHPVDVYESKEGLHLDVACTGLTKEDVNLDIEGDVLRVSYEKNDDILLDREYHYQGIAKRSFNFGYKVNINRFRLSEVSAEMENGLLTITIPFSPQSITKVKTIEIK